MDEAKDQTKKTATIVRNRLPALATRAWEIFGFGTQYAWLLALVYGSVFFRLGESETWIWWSRIAIALGMVVAYGVLFLGRTKLPSNFFRPAVTVGAGVVSTMGTSLLVFPLQGGGGVVVLVLAGLLCGASSAYLMLGGNKAWSGLRPERVMMHVTLSALAAVLLNYLLVMVHPIVACVVVCLLPLAGSLILSRTRLGGRPRPSNAKPVGAGSSARGLAFRMMAHVFVFSLAMGCMVSIMVTGELGEALLHWNVQAMLGGLAIVVVSTAVALLGDPVRLLMLFSRAAMPLMMAGLILLCVSGPVSRGFAAMSFLAGFIAADLFTWFLNSELVARGGGTSLEVLARSAVVQWVAFVVGLLCGRVFGQIGETATHAVFAALALLLVAEQAMGLTPIHAARLVDDRHDPLGEEGLQGVCAALAAEHGLTARELDVLVLLAHGRSVPYVQEALSISQGTAKSHAHNIYRKLGISSRQALLDMVDEVADR